MTSLPVLPKDAHGPQPDLALRLHRQQVRVPRRRLVGSDLLAPDRPQHRRGRLARQLADELEKLEHGDFEGLTTVLSGIVKANTQVLFEGNNYAEEWHAEAARRGLPNNRTTVDALPAP